MPYGKIIVSTIVGVLVGLLLCLLKVDSGEPRVIEKHTTDTLIVYKIDTVHILEVKKEVKEKVDTHYITIRDSIYFPIFLNEYQFKEEGLFDFRVKGYNVEFISADIYQTTIRETIETTTNVTENKDKSALFIYAGFATISDAFYPKGGIALSVKNKWLISADIGYFQKKPMIAGHIGYNMLNR